MKVIQARNVNDAYLQGVELFKRHIFLGLIDKEMSRVGPVYVWPEPVTTLFMRPMERILWDGLRDCNPFFHFFESLWMLAGRNDVAFPTRYNQRFSVYSDDKVTFHGAYGHRWRVAFGIDQIQEIINHLRKEPTSRRAVMQIWDAKMDLNRDGLDLPCNCTVKFDIRHGNLNMIVFNRSNDVLFGAYGANAVHFSVLHEYMATRLGVVVGNYHQISSNYHVYENTWKEKVSPDLPVGRDLYDQGLALPMHLFREAEGLDGYDLKEIEQYVVGDVLADFACPAIKYVAIPYDNIWAAWKAKDRDHAFVLLREAEKVTPNLDWIIAARRWMERRVNK